MLPEYSEMMLSLWPGVYFPGVTGVALLAGQEPATRRAGGCNNMSDPDTLIGDVLLVDAVCGLAGELKLGSSVSDDSSLSLSPLRESIMADSRCVFMLRWLSLPTEDDIMLVFCWFKFADPSLLIQVC